MNTTTFFDHYFNNAQVNALLILDGQGTILRINPSFTRNFGYTSEQLTGQSFSRLFTEADRLAGKPAKELKEVRNQGQSADENYIIDARGLPLWCAGEAILVTDPTGIVYIIKDVVNLQAKKQLQLFLQDSADILETIFEVSADLPMMILDSSLKIEKVNTPFLGLFDLRQPPVPGTRLSQLEHPFWQGPEMRKEIRELLVTREPFRSRLMMIELSSGTHTPVRLDSKIIERPNAGPKKILIILETLEAQSA